MKLWLLRPRRDESEINYLDPWQPWYDKAFGFVIRAETEEIARKRADDNAYNENADGEHPWLDQTLSTCVELLQDGERKLIIKDIHYA